MEKKYFAAANSSGGFVSWFDDIFAPERFERIFIIKGGSGTGKSTLMRRIAADAEKRGFDCEYFYCSSDPDSLDGILCRSEDCRGIAVLDGTAPHVRDPKLPGACEEIINLGDFWDTEKLKANREEIADLCREKAELFGEVNEYLYTCGELKGLLRGDVARAINAPKLRAAAERLLSQTMAAVHCQKRHGDSEAEIRAISAISMKGCRTFDTYKRLGRYYAVTDVMDSAPFFFDALLDTAKRFGLSAIRAPMPLEPSLTEAVFFPELSLSIVTADGSEPYDIKPINMARFIDRGCFTSDGKRRRRLLAKCADELLDGALERLAAAKEVHSKIEAIYIGAMDFTALNKRYPELLHRIFAD